MQSSWHNRSKIIGQDLELLKVFKIFALKTVNMWKYSLHTGFELRLQVAFLWEDGNFIHKSNEISLGMAIWCGQDPLYGNVSGNISFTYTQLPQYTHLFCWNSRNVF